MIKWQCFTFFFRSHAVVMYKEVYESHQQLQQLDSASCSQLWHDFDNSRVILRGAIPTRSIERPRTFYFFFHHQNLRVYLTRCLKLDEEKYFFLFTSSTFSSFSLIDPNLMNSDIVNMLSEQKVDDLHDIVLHQLLQQSNQRRSLSRMT